jgi:MFS transporter, DHA2 family, multidrug resistance protein
MAPLIVRLVKKVPVALMIGFGYIVLVCAMWYFASFNLATNYGRESWARIIQGFGIAFLFVPTSQLAYSFLPKDKNNKASSLTNLFRNQGGSFGIAFVTTMVARRAQYHQSVLVTHITNFDRSFSDNLGQISTRLVGHGYSAADAATSGFAQVAAIVQQQASMFAFLDCFWLLGLVALAGPVLAIFIRKFDQQGGSGAAH